MDKNFELISGYSTLPGLGAEVELNHSKGKYKYTRFEKAAIIGARALQIAMGAPILVKLPPNIIDPLKIAVLEFEKGIIPITIKRVTK